jgi:hypothetical protein
MRDLRPKGIEINIDGKQRSLLFTINVIDELQERYDLAIYEVIQKLFSEEEKDKKESYKVLKCITTVLINEDVAIHNDESEEKWEEVTEKYIGRKLTIENMGYVAILILKAYQNSLTTSEEDTDPNLMSKQ